jgi:hypothetical protein
MWDKNRLVGQKVSHLILDMEVGESFDDDE